MNRIGKYVSLCLCLLSLTACSGGELPKYRVNPEAETWRVETTVAAEMERGPQLQTGNIGKWGHDHGMRQNDQTALNAEIIGVTLAGFADADLDVVDEAQKIEVAKARAQEELGREKLSADSPNSVLYFETDREYLIETRVLTRIDESVVDAPAGDDEDIAPVAEEGNLTLDLGFPQTMTVDEFSPIACSVDTLQYYHETEYTVTTALYDLGLEYVPDSFALSKSGELSVRYVDDQLAFYADDNGMMHLFFDVALPNVATTKEYVVSYRVRTSLIDGQETELELRKSSPIQLEATGVVAGNELPAGGEPPASDEQGTILGELEDGKQRSTSGEPGNDNAATPAKALEWCLQDGYSGSETITTSAGDQVYIAAKAVLPEWAAEHAAKNGLTIEWDSTMVKQGSYMRQVRLRLKSCPANYGGAAIVYEITLDKAQRDHLTLASVVADPITFWHETEQGEPQLAMTRDQYMSIHYDLTTDADGVVHNVTQLSLEGETASQLGNEFYVVCGMGVRQIEQD